MSNYQVLHRKGSAIYIYNVFILCFIILHFIIHQPLYISHQLSILSYGKLGNGTSFTIQMSLTSPCGIFSLFLYFFQDFLCTYYNYHYICPVISHELAILICSIAPRTGPSNVNEQKLVHCSLRFRRRRTIVLVGWSRP